MRRVYKSTDHDPYRFAMPNAGAHLLPEAGATQERTLEAVRCSAWFGAGVPRRSALASPYSKPHALMPVPPSMAWYNERKPMETQEAAFDSKPNGSDAFSIPTVANQSPAGVGYTERAPGRQW